MKYLIKIKYDGSSYYGWNKQSNFNTIQESLENAFSKILNDKVKITASGRIDRYVHALNQLCILETNTKIRNYKKRIINKEIKNIYIKKIKKINDNFSFKINFINKTYLYKIYTKSNLKSLKQNNYQLNFFSEKIDINKLKKDALELIGKKDFSSFTAKTNYSNYFRKINYIKIKKRLNYIYIEINGNGFLRYMVRNIVGALLARNTNKLSLNDFYNLIYQPERGKCNYKVSGRGLYLKKVNYFV